MPLKPVNRRAASLPARLGTMGSTRSAGAADRSSGRKRTGGSMKDYAAVVEREADGRYSDYVPDLPGCASMGDARRRALVNVREAVACYIEGHQKLGRPLPRRRARVEIVTIHAA